MKTFSYDLVCNCINISKIVQYSFFFLFIFNSFFYYMKKKELLTRKKKIKSGIFATKICPSVTLSCQEGICRQVELRSIVYLSTSTYMKLLLAELVSEPPSPLLLLLLYLAAPPDAPFSFILIYVFAQVLPLIFIVLSQVTWQLEVNFTLEKQLFDDDNE